MADTIYLIRGQDLNVTAVFNDESGSPITIDGTYTVTSSMQSMKGCQNVFALSPDISDGAVTISRTTDDLADPKYVFDIIAKPASGTREITAKIFLQLEQPVTPLT